MLSVAEFLRVLVALDICAYVISNLINYFTASILEYFIRLGELHALAVRVGKLDVAQIGETKVLIWKLQHLIVLHNVAFDGVVVLNRSLIFKQLFQDGLLLLLQLGSIVILGYAFLRGWGLVDLAHLGCLDIVIDCH